MNEIYNSVYRYYTEHFDALSPYRQFHLASRLYLWSRDPLASARLDELRQEFTGDGNPARAFRDAREQARQETKAAASTRTGLLRQPHLDKYPLLLEYNRMMFRCLFMRSVYGLDTTEELFRHVSRAQMEELGKRLVSDEPAVAMLSTHAINFLYLATRFFGVRIPFEPSDFMALAHRQYDLSRPDHLRLYGYLYTHCLVADSLFYYRTLPAEHLTAYFRMLGELEGHLETHFEEITLDSKYEFLVCARMAGYASRLTDKIDAQTRLSIAHDGAYITDTLHRSHHRPGNDLERSEHRNVLFLMSASDYKPLLITPRQALLE